MTPTEIGAAVRGLRTQGHSLREISRLLAMSRNTVRRILREPAGDAGGEPLPCDEATLVRLKAAFTLARGNVVRVRELLADDGLECPTAPDPLGPRRRSARSAATRRRIRLRARPGDAARHLAAPGDIGPLADRPTSPSRCNVPVWCWRTRAGCSSQYYPRFTRFEARASCSRRRASWRASAGLHHRQHSVLLAAGAGADAVIAPEIAAFARTLASGSRARVGNPDRKGRIERPFAYVETNFLVGRNFADLDDLNRQALAWCRDTANHRHNTPQAGAGHVARRRLRHPSSRTSFRCQRLPRRSTSCSNASSICTAMSRSIRIAIRSPSGTSVNSVTVTKTPAKSRFATSPPRSPPTAG